MSRRAFTRAVFYAAVTVNAAGYFLGVYGAAWFWFVNWAVALLLVVESTRLAGRCLDTSRAYQAMVEDLTGNAITATRCAGCHRATIMATGPEAVAMIEEGRAAVPAGWGVRNDRLYCGTCLGKAETTA